uniref:Uncharacterized protein n=1 Tax=Arundo donax TaxID=35708 RepID=A0A0A8Z6P9_ARUDO
MAGLLHGDLSLPAPPLR